MRNRRSAKDAGARWEREIAEYLRDEWGFDFADRRVRTGADKGDIGGLGLPVVIQAKHHATYSISEWLNDAQEQADNAKADMGVVWAHRKGKASPGEGFVILRGEDFATLLAVWRNEAERRMAGYLEQVPG
jgi:hypothetical protein